jgi:hypothetical protein
LLEATFSCETILGAANFICDSSIQSVSQFRIIPEVDGWSYVGVAERVKLNFYKIPLIKKDELWRKKRND